MLNMTIGQGEYVLIGEAIKVYFNRTKGKELSIGIDAPRDLKVLRRSHYEDGVEKMAVEGNPEAVELSSRLKEEHAERLKKISKSHTRRVRQKPSTAAV
jgi:sRNA-binding carbon storage regulator CsrA